MDSGTLNCDYEKNGESSPKKCHFVTPCNMLVQGFRLLRLQPCLSLIVCLLLGFTTVADAFSARWDQPSAGQQEQQLADYGAEGNYGDPMYNESEMESTDEEETPSHADQYVNILKRWGHQSRFPWRRLRNGMCFRKACKRDKECCKQYSICDKSARVCVDCWYGSNCKSERDCCMKYPYCARVWKKSHNGKRYIASGKCVRKL